MRHINRRPGSVRLAPVKTGACKNNQAGVRDPETCQERKQTVSERSKCRYFICFLTPVFTFLYLAADTVSVPGTTSMWYTDTAWLFEHILLFLFLFHKGFSHLDVMLVECYDPKADQWNILQTPILEGRSGPGCAVLDDSIVLVGGYSWSMVRSDIF